MAKQTDLCRYKYWVFLTQNMTTEKENCFCRYKLGIRAPNLGGILYLWRAKTGAIGINLNNPFL